METVPESKKLKWKAPLAVEQKNAIVHAKSRMSLGRLNSSLVVLENGNPHGVLVADHEKLAFFSFVPFWPVITSVRNLDDEELSKKEIPAAEIFLYLADDLLEIHNFFDCFRDITINHIPHVFKELRFVHFKEFYFAGARLPGEILLRARLRHPPQEVTSLAPFHFVSYAFGGLDRVLDPKSKASSNAAVVMALGMGAIAHALDYRDDDETVFFINSSPTTKLKKSVLDWFSDPLLGSMYGDCEDLLYVASGFFPPNIKLNETASKQERIFLDRLNKVAKMYSLWAMVSTIVSDASLVKDAFASPPDVSKGTHISLLLLRNDVFKSLSTTNGIEAKPMKWDTDAILICDGTTWFSPRIELLEFEEFQNWEILSGPDAPAQNKVRAFPMKYGWITELIPLTKDFEDTRYAFQTEINDKWLDGVWAQTLIATIGGQLMKFAIPVSEEGTFPRIRIQPNPTLKWNKNAIDSVSRLIPPPIPPILSYSITGQDSPKKRKTRTRSRIPLRFNKTITQEAKLTVQSNVTNISKTLYEYSSTTSEAPFAALERKSRVLEQLLKSTAPASKPKKK